MPQRKLKIAFICAPGLQNFIDPIVNRFENEYNVRKYYTIDPVLWKEAAIWADVIWLEWANEVAVNFTNGPYLTEKNKVILRLHSYEALVPGGVFVKNINWEKVDATIFVSETIRDITFSGLAIQDTLRTNDYPIYIIPNGVDLDKFKFKERKHGHDIGYLGSINFKKGPILLFHAFYELWVKDNDYRLHIAGEFQDVRYKLYLNQFIKETGMKDAVIIYGHVKDPHIWLDNMNYIVNSSVLEGHPVGLAEAMAIGIKPLIHNFYGAKNLYPESWIWTTISEFLGLFSQSYNSAEYNKLVIESGWTLECQIKTIKTVIDDLNIQLKEETIDSLAEEMTLNVIKNASNTMPSIDIPKGMTMTKSDKSTNHDKSTEAAIGWIKKNSIETDSESSAIIVSKKNKVPYPEVTGYLIPTLLAYGEDKLVYRYVNFLKKIQSSYGSFPGPSGSVGISFDTGQALRGFTSILPLRSDLHDNITKAVEWLIWNSEKFEDQSQRIAVPDDASWMSKRGKIPEIVNLYVLHPMSMAGGTNESIAEYIKYYTEKYLNNILFDKYDAMLSHLYGYVIEAMMELKCDASLITQASASIYNFCIETEHHIVVPAYYDVKWCCLPGQAQMALCWAKMGLIEKAEKALRYMKMFQHSSGGFPGSIGLNADYFQDTEISWAVKFFLDASYEIENRKKEILNKKNSLPCWDNKEDPGSETPASMGTNSSIVTNPDLYKNIFEKRSHKTQEENFKNQYEGSWTVENPAKKELSPEAWHAAIVDAPVITIVNRIKGDESPEWYIPVLKESNNGDVILELGSGTGELSANLFRNGRKVILMDFSRDSLNYSSNVFSVLGFKGDFRHGNVLEEIKMDDNSVDWVFSVGLIEHFENDNDIQHIMKESYRIARKGVISLVPYAKCLPYRLGKHLQEQKGVWKWGKEIPRATMKNHFQEVGFKAITEYSFGAIASLRFLEAEKLEKVWNLATELRFFYNSLDHDELKNMDQGYMLVTTGKKEWSSKNDKEKPKRLAVIPNDPVQSYIDAGYPDLTSYFNPNGYFDKVYCLSPWEKRVGNAPKEMYEMDIIPMEENDTYFQKIKEFGIDCIRAYDLRALDFVLNHNPGNAVPIIVSVHDTNKDRVPDIKLESAPISKYIAMSKVVKEFLIERGANEEKIEIMPNRVDIDIFKPYQNPKGIRQFNELYPWKYKILCIGRWSVQKNQETLLKALEILGPDYGYIFIGKGCTTASIPLDLNGQIDTQESVPNHELPMYYSLCDCFCVPSRWEGFGIVFAEAMACEAIVVTSNIAPMNEYIEHRINGLLIGNHENFGSIVTAIKEACEGLSPIKKTTIKTNARLFVKEHFSKEIIDKQETEIYAKTIAEFKSSDVMVKPPVQVKKNDHSVTKKITIFNDDIVERWNTAVNLFPDAWMYHTAEWQKLLVEAWNAKVFSFCIEEGSDILAMIPLTIMPGSQTLLSTFGPGGIAFHPELPVKEKKQFFTVIIRTMKQITSSNNCKNIVIPLPALADTGVVSWNWESLYMRSAEFEFKDMSTKTYIINFNNQKLPEIYKKFRKNLRYDIKQAKEKYGVKVHEAEPSSENTIVDIYYDLHSETYTRTGVKPHPKAYFQKIFEYFVKTGLAKWFIAEVDGKVVAIDNIAIFKNRALYWTNASNDIGQTTRANKLLQWKAIQSCHELNLDLFESGEGFPNANPDTKEHGLDFFKKSFGGKLYSFRKIMLSI